MRFPESVIICEGYHDRAFWAEMLLFLQCRDPGQQPDQPRVKVLDPGGRPVQGGQFGFYSRSEKFIRIIPSGGKSNVLPVLRDQLKGRHTRPISNLIVNIDSGLMADGSKAAGPLLGRESLLTLINELDPNYDSSADGTEIKLDNGATTLFLAPWTITDPPSPGVPHQQTLERLLCASLLSVKPTWGQAVQTWLESRPDGPAAGPKSYAWSYLAGWYAEDTGSFEGFCRMVWKKQEIRGQLRHRLESSGLWRVAEIISA